MYHGWTQLGLRPFQKVAVKERPENLRRALGSHSCEDCKHFKAEGRTHMDERGSCERYDGYAVEKDQICDKYEARKHSAWHFAFDNDWMTPSEPGGDPYGGSGESEPAESSMMAAYHTGQIPGDEALTGDLQIDQYNPNAGVNPSFIGHVTSPDAVQTPVYVKPQGSFHYDDLAAERAAFAVAHHMGISMPHTIVRDTPHGVAQVQQSVGGRTMSSLFNGPRSFAGFIDQYPQDARRISLLDNVIGNVDRHLGNIVKGDDGNIYPIDHGGAFARPGGLSKKFSGVDLTPQELQSIKRAGTLDLTETGIDPEAHQEMQERINKMLNTGQFL